MRVAGSIDIKYHGWRAWKKKSQTLRDRRCKYNNRVYGICLSVSTLFKGSNPIIPCLNYSQSVVSRLIIPVSHHLSHLSPLGYMPYNKAL